MRTVFVKRVFLFLSLMGMIVFPVREAIGQNGTTKSPKGINSQTGKLSADAIEITARKAAARYSSSGSPEVVLDGKVRVKQGDVTMTCDRLIIVYEERKSPGSFQPGSSKESPPALQIVESVKTITAVGDVRIVQSDRMAVAGKAVFDNLKRTITLSEGPPRLWQGQNVLEAGTIVIYLDENRSELHSDNGKDITVLIKP